jgi:hypothetical protein
LPDGSEALARLAGARLDQQRVVEILPKLFMLPQVNHGGRLMATLIHHESDSAHGNNLAEKCAEANFNLTTKTQRHEEKFMPFANEKATSANEYNRKRKEMPNRSCESIHFPK